MTMEVSDRVSAVSRVEGLALSFEEVAGSQPLEDRPSGALGWMESLVGGANSKRVVLRDAQRRCVGTVLVERADESRFVSLACVDKASVERAVLVSDLCVDPQRAAEILPALLYFALRRARIWERATAVAYLVPGSPGADLLGLERLTQLPASGAMAPFAQVVDYGIRRAYRSTSGDLLPLLQSQFVPEAVEMVETWLERFFQTAWFRAVREGTLTKQQYIYTLGNQHQYVRWTTRLIGHAVARSEDKELRRRWLHHLDEEVDHEELIENDLRALGADVDYVKNEMVPNVGNHAFMAAQESVIGFRQDPVVFMAAPLVAEGFAAHLSDEFSDALLRVVKSWGVENPKKATTFIISHIHFDRGTENHEGHWDGTRRILEKYLDDDAKLGFFLNVMRIAMYGFERSYRDFAEDLAVFAAKPSHAQS